MGQLQQEEFWLVQSNDLKFKAREKKKGLDAQQGENFSSSSRPMVLSTWEKNNST